jgi:hypothetical protein
MEGHPEIIEIKADENSKYVAGEVWHSDVTCNPIPPMGSMLYLHKIPDNGGGDTLFINMYRAYETLSAPVRNLIDGLTAAHDGDRVYRLRQRKNVTGDLPRAAVGCHRHPSGFGTAAGAGAGKGHGIPSASGGLIDPRRGRAHGGEHGTAGA